MKYLKYLFVALLGLFTAACAEEDPRSIGALNPKVTVSQITATTANITIDLTDCAELIPNPYCRCWLIINNTQISDWFIVRSDDNPTKLKLAYTAKFQYLTPSTTYQFYIEITDVFGTAQSVVCRSNDFTFTTAKEGDYSAITKLEPYEILISDNLCEIGFKSNFLMYLESIVISENSDLSHPISLLDSTVKTNHYKAGYTEYIITFRNLKPNTTYYWAVSGRFNTSMAPLPQEYRSEIFKFTTKSSTE